MWAQCLWRILPRVTNADGVQALVPLQDVSADNVVKGQWGKIQTPLVGWWAASSSPAPVWLRNAVWFVLTLLVILYIRFSWQILSSSKI